MSGLGFTIRQQDGSLVAMSYADTVHNRQLADFIRRHEGFAKPDLQSLNQLTDNASERFHEDGVS